MIGDMIPKRATVMSAGYDFYAPCDIPMQPNQWTTVDTGVRFTGDEKAIMPSAGRNGKTSVKQWVMMIFPRSGLGMKCGMRFANTVGIIDMDYRDTIKIKMTVDSPYTVHKGERMAQGLIIPYCVFEDEETPKEKRTGGMGSTGA